MDILTNEQLRELTVPPDGVCVSLYMPTYPLGREAQQGSIRLKNLLRKVTGDLAATGLRAPDIRALTGPADELLLDGAFWQHQSEGLALFLSAEKSRACRLPLHFQEMAIVSDRFYLKPLLPLFTSDATFFVLAISQNRVRLLRCSRYNAEEVPVRGMPTSLAEALKYDDPERQLQFHTSTSTPSGGRKRSALFHGHGVGVDDNKPNLLRYFHQVDAGLQEILRTESAPLVFAGVEYLLPIYREANSYNHLLDQGIEGNPDPWNSEDLRSRAWTIVEGVFSQAQQNALARYRELIEMQSPRASDAVTAIVPAAYGGRIDTLFIDVAAQRWGSFDLQTAQVQVHPARQISDQDLLDAAAVQTILNRGTVYAFQPEEMPLDSPVGAIFRY